MSENPSFFDTLPSKTSFIVGFVAAILVLGTLGFIFLGSCLLRGTCGGDGSPRAANPNPTAQGNTAPVANAPSPSPATPPPTLTDDDHARGAKDASITIVEYSDFECPFCSRFHPTLQQAMTEYEGKIRWVYRHFPLSFHPQARPAALASECAAEQGKFWEYADKLFENQTQLSDTYYTQLAGELGLNTSQFKDCYDSEEYASRVDSDQAGGAQAGISGTPGSFIIGEDGSIQEIRGAQPYSAVKAAIDALL